MNTALGNPNLSLFPYSSYQGLAVCNSKGPLIHEYLDRTWETIAKAQNEYPRLLAIRVDLNFPVNPLVTKSNETISRFIDNLKNQIAQDRLRSSKIYKRVHDTRLRYVWVREYGRNVNPHYHLVLLLNHDAYYHLGTSDPGIKNLFSLIQIAWAKVLGLGFNQVQGLIHRPENAEFYLDRRTGKAGLADLFYRTSYLCKVESKNFKDGNHCFGCSRF